jgi:hypothetical protein
MEEIDALVIAECRRFGELQEILTVGNISANTIAEISNVSIKVDESDGILNGISKLGQFEFAIIIMLEPRTDMEARTLGHLLAGRVQKGLLVVEKLKYEIPIPLIELKRGLLRSSAQHGFRIYGKTQ